MKAERRHELQTNSLALWLRWKAPELWQKYGTYFLLVVLGIAVVFVFVKRRWEAPNAALTQAYDKLAQAKGMIEGGTASDVKDALGLVQNALTLSDQPRFQAQGNLALGDTYWALICIPQTSDATSRPAVSDSSREELFKRASEGYTQAMKILPGDATIVASAQMGLAALEETQAFEIDRASNYKVPAEKNPHWAMARERYEAVVNLADAPGILKMASKGKIEQLPILQKPIWVSTRPATTFPSTTQSTTQSTTRSIAATQAGK